MEMVKNACDQPIIPRKRPSDYHSSEHDLEKLIIQRPMVQAVRDFPPGCGFKEADRKPLKILRNVHSRPTEFRRNKLSFASKPAGKVKFWDPACTKEGHDQQPKVTTTIVVSRAKPLKNADNVDSNLKKLTSNGETQKSQGATTTGSQKEHARRLKIKEVTRVCNHVYTKLLQAKSLKSKGVKISHLRVSVEATKIAKQMVKWLEPQKSLGPICGVRIGDKFKHRAQLKMIGLHCQLVWGIDYANINGKNLTISIVDSHRYSNERADSDKLIYCGHGGLGFSGRQLPPEDQKLECGNLALKNSMYERNVVRVIRKVGVQKNVLFVYDGLFAVVDYAQETNEEGKIMFKFYLNRAPGQPSLHLMLNASC